jgi:formimidoylglutamase
MPGDALTDPWQNGRSDDGERGDTRRLHHIVRPVDLGGLSTEAEGHPLVLGFASDAGVRRNRGRPGAAEGPAAIRRMLSNLAAHELQTLLDAGDITCEGEALEAAQQACALALAKALSLGAFPVLLGGGHEIAVASFMGLRRYLDDQGDAGKVLVLNIDAHLDLRTSRPPSSGTPFDEIARYCEAHGHAWRYACIGVSKPSNTAALFARADEIGAVVVADEHAQERHLDALREQVATLLQQAHHVYLTIDIDALPAAVAPGVSAPAALGVPVSVVEAIIGWVADSGKLRVADLAELNPAFDPDGRTARVAARLAWKLLHAAACSRREGTGRAIDVSR